MWQVIVFDVSCLFTDFCDRKSGQEPADEKIEEDGEYVAWGQSPPIPGREDAENAYGYAVQSNEPDSLFVAEASGLQEHPGYDAGPDDLKD